MDPEGNQTENAATHSPGAAHLLSAAFRYGMVLPARVSSEQYGIAIHGSRAGLHAARRVATTVIPDDPGVDIQLAE